MTKKSVPPVVLSISGHDPTGGAGIQADIETISANGCHAATAVTCLTVQDTRNVQRLAPVEPDLLEQQARVILQDLPVAAIKIGLIGSSGISRVVGQLLQEYPDIPVVFDPVLAAGGGTEFSSIKLLESIRHDLLPRITLLTPNSIEARRLSKKDALDECAHEIISMGCDNVLITGTHEIGEEVENRLYLPQTTKPVTWSWPRLPDTYHGSGCTLASAIASRLARGIPLIEATSQSQQYTWDSLKQANRLGHGQAIPYRHSNA